MTRRVVCGIVLLLITVGMRAIDLPQSERADHLTPEQTDLADLVMMMITGIPALIRLGHPDQPAASQPQSIVDPLANNCGVGGGGQAGENVMCASAAVQLDPFDMVTTAGFIGSQYFASKANPNQATNFNN